MSLKYFCSFVSYDYLNENVRYNLQKICKITCMLTNTKIITLEIIVLPKNIIVSVQISSALLEF